ncbi:MAG: formylglycine-generating enzyme family protein [Verrucomicrobiales bacterium]|nr:formylglycine-generating enzyme family protein [Verrucomicrobiales bacterium]
MLKYLHLLLIGIAISTTPHLSLGEEPKDDITLTEKIRARILKKSTELSEGAMSNYSAIIPSSKVPYDMIAIKGGTFLMGSPADEKKRAPDEGPQRNIKVEPFWMGKYEITWNQYEPFGYTDYPRRKNGSILQLRSDAPLYRIVSAPTTAYTEMSFGMGTGNHPAICMTQHAASKFCQWLSAQTGHYYRLPTEAEWEYACRAGTTTAYSFGDDPSQLKNYAVYDANQYAVVGTKKPNPWGIYDMHGNVLEWCLDQYYPNAYSINKQIIPALKLYPRVSRGGSWYDYEAGCRSATRYPSNRDWKLEDPQNPKSLWHHADAQWLGFRIVRPLKIPSTERMHQLWNSGNISDYDKNKKNGLPAGYDLI